MIANVAVGQEIAAKNGWYLPTSGALRVLVIFGEIEYDLHPEKDPLPNGSDVWKKGKLPEYRDSLFDPFWNPSPHAAMTAYYAECSFGQLMVLGDYVNAVITVKESEVHIENAYSVKEKIREKINEMPRLLTANHLSPEDFDYWKGAKIAGAPKVNKPDDPHTYDHVMLFLRNYHRWGSASGNAGAGNFGKIHGFGSDSQSNFTGGNYFPFDILHHEFNHLLVGGNNFHVGGGLGAGAGYFIPTQGGWSMMGGANSCFLTCNAWDRNRFYWKPDEKIHIIGCLDENGEQTNADLNTDDAYQQGIYILRDFITTGDALRVKLSNIPGTEFEQWIWIENHQTSTNNGSRFDRFHYQQEDCVTKPTPGIYAYLQVDKAIPFGSYAFGGFGDYLRPMPADGMYDFQFEWTKQQNACVNQAMYYPFMKNRWMENPLTGCHDLEIPPVDLDSNGRIYKKEQIFPAIEKVGSEYHKNLFWLGHSRHAFTLKGNHIIGMGTNPSTASMITLVSDNTPIRSVKKNNRITRLNGVEIRILEELEDGSIKVSVRFDQTRINDDARWCSDSIVLPTIPTKDGYSLVLSSGKKIFLSRSRTPTRIDHPDKVNGEIFFSDPTTLFIETGARMKMESRSAIKIEDGSRLVFDENTSLVMDKKAVIKVEDGVLVFKHLYKLLAHPSARVKVSRNGRLVNKSGIQLVEKKGILGLRKGWYKVVSRTED